jgi:uncharacterized protein (TIGR03437 family)
MRRIHYYFLVATLPLLAQSVTFNTLPSREFGQPQLDQPLESIAPNLVEGRELYQPSAIAFDTSVSPPILYVADTYNNRVLAFPNPDSLTKCGTSSPSCGFASSTVISQRDLTSTLAGGPGTSLSAGLSLPTGIAVDSSGNLYVADSGNNRILRFPSPLKQTGVLLTTDLVIGQLGPATGNSPNQGLQAPTASTLSLNVGAVRGGINPAGLAIDASGNLWVADPGNHRVLRFPFNGSTIATTADRVLGQFSFTSGTVMQPPAGTPTQLYPYSLYAPSGVAFDKAGNLYVSDSYSRVLYYTAQTTGSAALRILGVNQEPTQTNPTAPPYPNQYTLGAANSNGQLISPPLGVFTNGTNVFVADTGSNRIAEYDVPANWPPATTNTTTGLPSPPILAVVGQVNLTTGSANTGQPGPIASTLSGPVSGAFLGTEMWVVDSNNNRVLALPQQTGGTPYTAANRVVGQLDFIYSAPNLIEGREMYFNGLGDVAVDINSTPPHLYIADPGNNRVLGFNDARNVTQNSKADIVIGQTDLFHSTINSPYGCSPTSTTVPCIGAEPGNAGLNSPTALVVDTNGNLYVADTGNGRVLRFPSPFAPGATQQANLVLGQVSFGPPIQNPSQQNMGQPSGLALNSDTVNTALYVSDGAYNRVLVFIHPAGQDFSNGQLASVVLGQTNFTTTAAATASGTTPASTSGLNTPQHIATDTSDRLYVADTGNNRVLVFTNAKFSANGAASVLTIPNLNAPQGVTVNPLTGEIFVADSGAYLVNRYPEFNEAQFNLQLTGQISFQTHPIAVTLDASGNPVIAEAANRVTFYFPALAFQNSANYNSQPLAPGMLALLYRQGLSFSLTSVATPPLPWPKVMNDIQVTVNGEAAPIFRLDPTDIAFMVPSDAPTSGTATFLVQHQSTGEILGAYQVPMAQQNPGFYTSNAQGTGEVAAINYDQTPGGATPCTPQPGCAVNSQSNPVVAGHIIEFYLTGQGPVPGSPPDGTAPGAIMTPVLPTIITEDGILPASGIGYSGLAPGEPGLWQINMTVPLDRQATGVNPIAITLNGTQSNIGPNGAQISTTFAVK